MRLPPHPQSDTSATPPARTVPLAAVLVGLIMLLLVVGAWFNGGFPVTDWGPLAVLVLTAVAVLGANRSSTRAGWVFPALLGAFAVWTIVSTAWSDSPTFGMESATRNLLYAGLAALPLVAVATRNDAVRLGAVLVACLAALVAVTFVLLVTNGTDLLLAGRLNAPIGYRNGTAAIMAMAAVALVCAAAPRDVNPVLRATAFALAVAALGLGFLTQSRGVLIGFAAGALVAVLLGPDRLRRVWLLLAAVGLVAVVSGRLLNPYDAFIARARTSSAELSSAVDPLVLVTLVAFLAMAAAAVLDGRLGHPAEELRALAAGALVVVVVIAAGGALIRVGNPVTFVSDKVDEFKTLEPTALGATRFGSTGGQRYDLWRIAVHQFQDAPLIGAGEGSYPTRYYLERSTDRNLTVAHSLPIGVLGDNGVIGLLLLLGAFGAVPVALSRRWRELEPDARRTASALIGAGAVVVAQSAVDWLWSIAALAGLAVLAIALGLRAATAPAAVEPRTGRSSLPLRAGAAVAALLVVFVVVSATYVKVARAERGVPERVLNAAQTAQRFAPYSVTPLYLEAGARESQGDVQGARNALLEALDKEPRSFVTLGLLGDLETRARHEASARGYYRRGLALNPGDVGLRALSRGSK